uniref:peptidylprolyl isomerase n=1 Tax=Spumella elongata TaxID=89044 RepID=A0A7S3GTR9_9STRA
MATTGDDGTSWEEVMGKDLVTKVLRKGSGGQAEMGTVVMCNLKGFFVENEDVSAESFEEWTNQSFKIGESDAIPGVEMALRFSRVGDILRVRCNSRFGYGPTGRPEVVIRNSTEVKEEGTETAAKSIVAIPADKDLEYELEILSHLPDGDVDPVLLKAHPFDESHSVHSDEVDASDEDSSRAKAFRDYTERLQALTELQQRKEAGNRWFSYGDFARSARAYSKATQIADRYFNGNANSNTPAQALQGLTPSSEEGEGAAESNVGEANAALEAAEKAKEAQRRTFQAGDEEVVAVYVSCLNNLAACQLRLGDNAKVKDICIRVLEIDPANHKALLRAAKAALATHDYEECEVCLQRLVEVAPPGSSAAVAAATERRRLKQAQLEYKQQQKKMSDNMARQLFNNKSSNSNSSHSNNNTTSGTSGSSNSSSNSTNSNSSTTIEAAAPQKAVAAAAASPALTSVTPAAAATTAAATTATATATAATAATGSADWGLLLLLLTSLAVLLVSICLVVWTNKK